MATHWYTVALESDTLLAVEVDYRGAAEALAAGHQVVLADRADLAHIAARRQRELVVRAAPFSHIHRFFPRPKVHTDRSCAYTGTYARG
jgi:hypothetical protein